VEAEDFTGAIAVYQRQLPWSQNPRIFSSIGYLQARQEISQQPWQLIDRRLPSTPTMPIFHWATVWEFEDNAGAATATRTIELDRNYLNAYLGLGVVLSGKLQRGSLGISASVRPRT